MNSTLTQLQAGMRVLFAGRPHRVVMVNDCRARIVPEQKRVVQIQPLAGKAVTFERQEDGHNISPNSELEIL